MLPNFARNSRTCRCHVSTRRSEFDLRSLEARPRLARTVGGSRYALHFGPAPLTLAQIEVLVAVVLTG
jgi:hypothetical protein